MTKTLTVLTPCYNEKDNVREVYLRQRVRNSLQLRAGDFL